MAAVPSGSDPDLPRAKVHRLLEQADALTSARRFAAARGLYRLAIERDRSPTARHAFGCFLAKTGCEDEAIDLFESVLEEARRSGSDRLCAAVANNLAALYRQHGEPAIAAGYQQQAVSTELRSMTADGELSAGTLLGCAGDALLAGESARAAELFQRSLVKHTAERSVSGQADCRGALGVVAAMNGDADRAERSLRRAYRQHRSADDLPGAGADLMNLAAVYTMKARWRKAILCLTLAAELLEQAGHRSLCLQARRRLEQMVRIMAVRSRDPLLN